MENQSDEISKVNDTYRSLKKLLDDIHTIAMATQIILGVASGWITGLVATRVGEPAAAALATGIIVPQLVYEKRRRINWEKVTKTVDDVKLKVEENIPVQKPNWDKVTKQVEDVRLKVEENVPVQGPDWSKVSKKVDDVKLMVEVKTPDWKDKVDKARSKMTEIHIRIPSIRYRDRRYEIQRIHIFLASFIAGLAIGIVTS